MDLDDFRAVLESSGVDVWTFLEAAITVASSDHLNELKQRRDGIIEKLYAASFADKCRNCDFNICGVSRSNGLGVGKLDAEEEERDKNGRGVKRQSATPPSPHSGNRDDDELDPFGGLFDDEQRKILEIKGHLEDPDQSEDSIVELLQSLADMDITFQALQETDIGRHVNRFRKHSSNDVRRLVKHLVRKWKQIVDEWVNVNQPGEIASSTLLGADGDSPQQKIPQNGYHKVPDFAPSPNPHTASSGSERNISEPEPKAKHVIRRETPPMRPNHPMSAPPAQNVRKQKESNVESDRLASARKRLHDSYREAENAKKQRTIQVMDIHEIPKPKNTFFTKNKAGGSQGRHW
ncbi:hypothetical protein CRG98_020985 [Punica granatum]|uniref:TFIIS N-terminal domain-containing protein n=1 Tax=Punica granatum TaxID=22663 RepID=A0A2I0JT01_PUNGR|nr:hypothetical protein CRG98_020985 [Punica granatum]